MDKGLFGSSVFGEFFKNASGCKRKYKGETRLDGKVVIITGANTGIGKETAYQLSLRGAKIIIACRDVNKGEVALQEIKEKNPLADITVEKLDLSSLTSVRQFAKTVAQKESVVDILINNAGVMNCPESKTEDGFEMQFGTNHLGHFLLTLSLMPLLKNSSNARVVNIASKAYMFGDIHFENINLRDGAYEPLKAYGQSKLANVLFTRELAKRLGADSKVKTYSLHPGLIQTDLSRHMSSAPGTTQDKVMKALHFTISPEMGAQTTLYCALEEGIENESGSYYDDCKRMDCLLAKARDDETAAKLWEISCDLVQLEEHLRI